jgi:hypothetical protein
MSRPLHRFFSPIILAASAAALASVAVAGTPDFLENMDGRNFPGNRVPTQWSATLGSVYTFAPAGASIQPDPTCDGLSTDVMVVDSTLSRGGFEVRFVHQEGAAGEELDVQEIMALKVGQERTDVWGMKVGFASTDNLQELPVQLGPALPSDPDPQFGRVYVFGQPTPVRYGNVFASTCSGLIPQDNRVNVEFKFYGEDRIYYIVIQSFGPVPQAMRLGPFDIPEPIVRAGYGSCMTQAQAGIGRAMVDGVECIASAIPEIDPISDTNDTHRETIRRRR